MLVVPWPGSPEDGDGVEGQLVGLRKHSWLEQEALSTVMQSSAGRMGKLTVRKICADGKV